LWTVKLGDLPSLYDLLPHVDPILERAYWARFHKEAIMSDTIHFVFTNGQLTNGLMSYFVESQPVTRFGMTIAG